jgi:hypothetical protein
MIDPKTFEEKDLKKRLRLIKQDGLMAAARMLGATGALAEWPKNPVFIVGSPRSGTSIFTRMVDQHPDVANLSEAIEIWEPKDTDRERDHVKTAADAFPRDAERIRQSFGLFQRLKGAAVFVNKNPRSSVRIGFIQEIFPEAKFINVVRDGRAVVNSILSIIRREEFRQHIPLGAFCKPRGWRDLLALPAVERHARQWAGIMEEIEASKQDVPAEHWHELRYEDLCAYPASTMMHVFDYMGLPTTEGLPGRIASMVGSQNHKWREKFTSEDIATMNEIMAPWLDRYGYATHAPQPQAPAMAEA